MYSSVEAWGALVELPRDFEQRHGDFEHFEQRLHRLNMWYLVGGANPAAVRVCAGVP
jgi:hypothetical protein